MSQNQINKLFNKGPDKYRETYTDAERAAQRKAIRNFTNTRQLIYTKLNALKKKNGWTDKDLELRGLYPHKLLDPWLNAYKEGRLAISGGGASVPLDLTGALPAIASVIRRGESKTPDPEAPSYVLDEYGDVNRLAEAQNDAARALEAIDELSPRDREIIDYIESLPEEKNPEAEVEDIDFSSPVMSGPSAAEDLARERVRERMRTIRRQNIIPSGRGVGRPAGPNVVKADRVRDLIEKLLSAGVWANDPTDPFSLFEGMSVGEQQGYMRGLWKHMDDTERQSILDVFTQYGVNLTDWSGDKKEPVRHLELGLQQNDLLNDGMTPLQRRADLIDRLRQIFKNKLMDLPPDTQLTANKGKSKGIMLKATRAVSELKKYVKERARKVIPLAQGEEIQAIPAQIVETQTLDSLMSEMKGAEINPVNINAFRDILTNGFRNDVMRIYRAGRNWDVAVEQAWIANERRISENIEEIKRNNPTVRYNFDNIKQVLLRIKDATQQAQSNMANIPAHIVRVASAATALVRGREASQENKDALRDVVQDAAAVAEDMKHDVLQARNVMDYSAMRREMRTVANSSGINLSVPSEPEYISAVGIVRRLVEDAKDSGEAFSVNFGGRVGRVGVGIPNEGGLSRHTIFNQMDEDDFNQLMNEYALNDDELATWNTMLHETPTTSKPAIIDILVARAAGTPMPNEPPEPDEGPPDGVITITAGGYRRRVKLSAWIAALIAAGVGVKKIADYVKKLKKEESDVDGKKDTDNISKDTKKDNDSNIVNPTKPENDNDNKKPMPPKPDPQFTDGADMPSMAGISTPAPDPVLGAYPIDMKGIGRMGVTPDVLDNINNYNELVRQYNQNIKDYEKFLTTGKPTGLFGTGVANASTVNDQIAKMMEDYKGRINSALPSLSQLPTGREATALAAPAQSYYAFKQYADGPLMKYNEMRKSATTKRLGLDDDIDTYNDKVKEYNKKMDDLAAKNPSSGMRPKIAGEDEYSINAAFKSLSGEMSPVARAERMGRTSAREITYSETDRAIIDKFIAARIEKGAKVQLTAEEEASIADNPELFDRIQKYQELLGRARTKEDVDKLAGYKDYFAKIKANDYRPLSYVKQDAEQYEMGQGFEAGLKTQAADATKVFDQSKKSYQAAQARLSAAIAAGAPKHQISQLYQDLDDKRIDYNTKQARYAESLTKLKDYGGVKTTYLGDMSVEVIPRTADERHLFARLQNVEAAIQSNPDALKMYNEKAMTIHKNPNTLDIYRKRLDYLSNISQQFGLAKEYATALNEPLEAVKIEEEEPIANINTLEDDINDNDVQYRAEMIDPAEAKLFLSTKQQAAAEQKRWLEFSTVAPNNGLGNVKTNPLLREEVNQYITRYSNTDKGPRPTMYDLEQRGVRRPRTSNIPTRFVPEIQCAFGRDHFENEFVIPSMIGGEVVTRADDDLPNNNYGTWVKPSIYHPEYQMMTYNEDLSSRNTMEGPYARDAKYRFLPMNVRPQYYPIDTREYLGKTMSDSFGSRLNFNNTLNVQNLNKVGAPPQPYMSIYDNSTIKKLGVKYR